MTLLRIIFPAVLLTLVCTTPSRGQAATDPTGATSGAAQLQPQTVPILFTTDYYAETKTLLLHATNNSGKEITGYHIAIQYRLPNGTWGKPGLQGSLQDMMDTLIVIQMAKDPIDEARKRQEYGVGLFAAGTTRDIIIDHINSADVKATADPIFYSDGGFEKHNDDQFKSFLFHRQSELLGIVEANKIIRAALEDPTNEQPIATALPELAKAAAQRMAHNPDGPYDPVPRTVGYLQGSINMLRMIQENAVKNWGTPSEVGKTERERLIQFVEKQEKRVELMKPHCHLEIALKQ